MNLKALLRRLYYVFQSKHGAELRYWQKCFHKEGGDFQNSHYAKLMLGIADEVDDSFLSAKVVADFGCGPRGSLVWTSAPAIKLGIDVLIPAYFQHFGNSMAKHGMYYLTSTEDHIPIPDAGVDILFCINSLDHVANPHRVFAELQRILKPGGLFIGSINLNHYPTKAEPLRLSEKMVFEELIPGWNVLHCSISKTPSHGYLYRDLLNKTPIDPHGAEAIMWIRAQKP